MAVGQCSYIVTAIGGSKGLSSWMSHHWTSPLHKLNQQAMHHLSNAEADISLHRDLWHWSNPLNSTDTGNPLKRWKYTTTNISLLSSDNWYFSSVSVLFYTTWLWPMCLTDSILDCCKVKKWMQCDLIGGTNMQVNRRNLEIRVHLCMNRDRDFFFFFIIVQPWLLIGASWQRCVF